MDRKKVLGIVSGALVIAVLVMIPPMDGMTVAGKNTLALLLGGLVLWVTEALPLAITALLLMVLQPIFGVSTVAVAMTTFISPVIFFVMATFGVSIAVIKTPLAARIACRLVRTFGGSSSQTILAFMIGSAVLSAIISNVPVTALFMSLAIGIIKASDGKPGGTAFGRAIMIAIPFSAMIGGIMTPAGSSINILALYLLETYSDVRVTFVEWMAFGIPICIVLLPISWIILVSVFRPEPIKEGVLEKIGADIPEKITPMEIKLLIITGLMVFLWIVSSWVPSIDITIVAMAALIAYFLPGVDILDWDEFVGKMAWDTIIMIGGVTSIGTAVVETGLGKWIVENSLMGFSHWHVVYLTIVVAMLVNLLHLILPLAPAIVAVMIPPLAELSIASNIHPAIFVMATSFLAGCCMLVPLDPVPLMTFTKRYYNMWDMFKVGSVTSVIWVLLVGIWVPLVGIYYYS